MFWIAASAIATVAVVAIANRIDSWESPLVKQALYLTAVFLVGLGAYNVYQWDAARSAPEQIREHVPLYPTASMKARVPVEHIVRVERLLASAEAGESPLGQWIYETTDSAMDVGRYYQNWVRRWRMPANVDVGSDYSSVVVNGSDYSMSVTARNRWGRTRITYTLTNPVG